MKIILQLDWEYPCDHPFFLEVHKKRLKNDEFEIIWVMRSANEQNEVRKVEWDGDMLYVLPKSAYDPVRVASLSLTGQLPQHPLAKIIADHSNADIIHVRNDLSFGLVSNCMKDEFGMKYIHQISHLKAETLLETVKAGLANRPKWRYFKGKIGQQLRKYISNRSDLVLPIGEEMRSKLSDDGYKTQMVPLTTGSRVDIDPKQIDPQPFVNQYDLESKHILLYLGSMNPLRNLEFLFDVISVLDEKDVQLVMMGGRSEENRSRLRRLAEERNVADRVTFTGWVDDETTINRALCAADIGLSPFPPNSVFRTNAPIKTLEYLSRETPVLATNIPDQRKVLTESGGGVVTDYTPKAFTRGIVTLLSDGNLEERGRAGREYVAKCRSYDKLAKDMRSIYRKVLSMGN